MYEYTSGKLVCTVIITVFNDVLVLLGIYDMARDDLHVGADHE